MCLLVCLFDCLFIGLFDCLFVCLFVDVLMGETDTIIAMVGLLMFGTHPLKEEKDIRDTTKLLGEQYRMTSEMSFCHGRLSYALRAVQEVITWGEEIVPFPPSFSFAFPGSTLIQSFPSLFIFLAFFFRHFSIGTWCF